MTTKEKYKLFREFFLFLQQKEGRNSSKINVHAQTMMGMYSNLEPQRIGEIIHSIESIIIDFLKDINDHYRSDEFTNGQLLDTDQMIELMKRDFSNYWFTSYISDQIVDIVENSGVIEYVNTETPMTWLQINKFLEDKLIMNKIHKLIEK